jgi:hypothetical protein
MQQVYRLLYIHNGFDVHCEDGTVDPPDPAGTGTFPPTVSSSFVSNAARRGRLDNDLLAVRLMKMVTGDKFFFSEFLYCRRTHK